MNLPIWNYDPAQENMLIQGGECFADPDPEEPGKFLIPAHATPVPARPDQDGKTQHFDPVSSAWYFKDLPPAHQPEPDPDPKEIRRAEIAGELARIDSESIRPSREVASALIAGVPAPDFAIQKIADLEKKAGDLRTELAGLQ